MEKNNSIKLLGFIFFFLLMGIAFFSFFNLGNPQTTQSQASTIKSTTSNTTYQIVAVDPPQDITKKQLPIVQIDFTFNDIVNPKTFYYDVSPKTDIYLKTHSAVLTLYPKDRWPNGTITITIAKSSSGAHGGKLIEPYIYKFTVVTP